MLSTFMPLYQHSIAMHVSIPQRVSVPWYDTERGKRLRLVVLLLARVYNGFLTGIKTYAGYRLIAEARHDEQSERQRQRLVTHARTAAD